MTSAHGSHHRLVVVGSGFAGIGLGIQLLQHGETDFVVLEKADEVGGTWRDNTYPGVQCDVETSLYSFSFAPNPHWTRRFGWGAEIQRYLVALSHRFSLRSHLRLGHELLQARFDEASSRWQLQTSQGPLSCDFLALAHGGLSQPVIPRLPGLSTFAGQSFHSAQWPKDLSLQGRRVGVVGTGASSVQIVPAIVDQVAHLSVFQRTPPWIMPRPDRPISDRAQSLFARHPLTQKFVRSAIYALRELMVIPMTKRPQAMRFVERLARRHLRRQVSDENLRARLTPTYSIGCKRILLSSDYYPALQRPHAHLVTDPIAEIVPSGVITQSGTLHALDTLVLSTGFQILQHPMTQRVFASDGQSLAERSRSGMGCYLGTTVVGMPNLFLLTGPNTGLGHTSMIVMMEAQFRYIVDALSHLRRSATRRMEVRADVATRYNVALQAQLSRTVWASGCVSWYLDEEGRNLTLWPTFTWWYGWLLRRFDPPSYDLRGGTGSD